MDAIREATKPYMRAKLPPLRSGDVVRVHERIQEGEKSRVQVFEGLVIARKHGDGMNATFTVRRIASRNVGVERIFPLHSPAIEKIEILRHEKVRRGKLYYIRNLIGKKTRRKKSTPIEEVFSFEPEKVVELTKEESGEKIKESSEEKTEEKPQEETPKEDAPDDVAEEKEEKEAPAPEVEVKETPEAKDEEAKEDK